MENNEKKEFLENSCEKVGKLVEEFNSKFPLNTDEKGVNHRGGGILTLEYVSDEDGHTTSSAIGMVGITREIVNAIISRITLDKDFANLMLEVNRQLNDLLLGLGSSMIDSLRERANNKEVKEDENAR